MTWRLAGKKKKRFWIAASCYYCHRWIKWLEEEVFSVYAPDKPPVAIKPADPILFDEPLGKQVVVKSGPEGTYLDAEEVGRQAKRGLPGPPDGRPLDAMELSVVLGRVWAEGTRLFLGREGKIQCNRSWGCLKRADSDAIMSYAEIIRKRMIEDMLWQMAAVRHGHVIRVHPKDTARLKMLGMAIPEVDEQPEMTADEVVACEKESCELSLTQREIERYDEDKEMKHSEAEPVEPKAADGSMF